MFEAIEPRRYLAGPLSGDFNFDGAVNIADYSIIDYQLGSGVAPTWYGQGDANGDRKINILDYGDIDFNAGKTLEDVTGPRERSLEGYRVFSGTITLSTPGQVFERFILRGGAANIVVTADNVTIDDFLVENGSHTGNAIGQANNEIKGLTVSRGIVRGGAYTTGIKVTNGAIRGCEIYNMRSDGIRAKGNDVIEGNWLHGIGLNKPSHADMIQQFPETGPDRGNCILRWNYFDASGNFDTDAILQHFNEDNLIQGNVFKGNSGDSGTNGRIDAENNIRYVGNVFFRQAPNRAWINADGGVTQWEGNFEAESGRLILSVDDV